MTGTWPLSAGLLALTGSWMLAALFFMDSLTGSRLSPPGLALLLPLSYLFNWRLRGRWWRPAVNIATSVIALMGMVWWQLYSPSPLLDSSWLFSWLRGLVQVYQGLNSEALLIPACLVLWWQGARLSSKRGTFIEWAAEFQFGVALWLLLLLLSRVMERGVPQGSTLLVVFLLGSLLGMSFSRLGESPARAGSRLWWWLFAAISFGVLLLGAAGALLITPGMIQGLSQWLLLPLHWLWMGIVWLLDLLARLLPSGGGETVPGLPSPPPAGGEGENSRFITLPPWLNSLLRGGWAAMVLGLVLAALWRLATDLVAWLRRLGTHPGETVEPMPGALGEDLRSLLRRALSWLRTRLLRSRRAPVLAPSSTASIRVLYRELLRRAGRAGYPRPPSHTPLEYLRPLQDAFPDLSRELEWVTHSYVPVRYGGLVFREETFTLEQKWSTIKSRLTRKGRKRK